MTSTQTKDPLRLVTPQATLSFPHLDMPWAGTQGTGDPKYGAHLVFPPDTDLRELKKAVFLAGQAKWPKGKFEEMLRAGQLRTPFRTDGEKWGYEKGHTFINPRTSTKPGIVGREAGADGKPKVLTDMELMYPGAQVRASVTAGGYDNVGKGVTFYLNNLQWLGHGERLDNRKPAEDEFEALETEAADMDDADDLSDLL